MVKSGTSLFSLKKCCIQMLIFVIKLIFYNVGIVLFFSSYKKLLTVSQCFLLGLFGSSLKTSTSEVYPSSRIRSGVSKALEKGRGQMHFLWTEVGKTRNIQRSNRLEKDVIQI